MIPVYQTIVNADTKGEVPGDCLRAAVASLLELNITQVPHFLMFGDDWFRMMYSFIRFMGYGLHYEYYSKSVIDNKFPMKDHLVKKGIIASVPSKTFKDATHAVIINSEGRVIHDPNPNKLWLSANTIETKTIVGWYVLQERED